MYMVGHKNPGMYRYAESGRTIMNAARISGNVFIAGEADIAVVSTLDHVNRMSSRAES
tara:strand:+ start:5032 stop:5205 length:174 start_codon:yes stop_codon:yes gene_type:complete